MDPNADDAQPVLPDRPVSYADGSRVLGMDGHPIGEVVASYREHLIVERGYFFPTNFYIPFTAVAEAGGGDIVLSVTRLDALRQGWERPPADPVAPVVTPLPAPAPDPTFAAPNVPATTARPVVVQPASAPPADPPPPFEAGEGAVPGGAQFDPETATPPTAPPESPRAAASDETKAGAERGGEPAVASPGEAREAGVVEPSPRVIVEAAAPPVPKVREVMPPDPGDAPRPTPVPAVRAESAGGPAAGQPEATAPSTSGEPSDPGTIEPASQATEGTATGGGNPPPFVGIPGRRLTDAELWSLLDPKEAGPTGAPEAPAEDADEAADAAAGDVSDRPAEPEKPEP